MKSFARSPGIVAFSVAALSSSVKKSGGASAFVQPRAAPVSSTRQAPPVKSRCTTCMSVFLPDDGSVNWDMSNVNQNADDKPGGQNPNVAGTSASASDPRAPYTTDQYDGCDGSFPLPDDVEVPETRQLRWEREALVQSKFASGDEIFEIRRAVDLLSQEIVSVRKGLAVDDVGPDVERRGAKRRLADLERKLVALKGRDAEFAYAVSLELLEKAQADGDEELMKNYKVKAEEARLCIPQLNMHGLWVGKYGKHGYEMINVTYSGDTLVATKVTGDRNVPKGEISFTANLSPSSPSTSGHFSKSPAAALEPIELDFKASRQWGRRFLPRHVGMGQVSSEGYSRAQWMEGQLILVGRFFAFAWVPIGHQVFFGRPSDELAVRMFREAGEEDLRRDYVAVMRACAEGMLEETYWEERENDDYFDDDGCFE